MKKNKIDEQRKQMMREKGPFDIFFLCFSLPPFFHHVIPFSPFTAFFLENPKITF